MYDEDNFDDIEELVEAELKGNKIDHRLNNITRLRATAAGLFGIFAIIGLIFGTNIVERFMYLVLLLINGGVVVIPSFIATYGKDGSERIINPLPFVKSNMIVSFINISVCIIAVLSGNGGILGLIILLPDVLLLTQVKMVYNSIGEVPLSSTNKTKPLQKKEYYPTPVAASVNAIQHSNDYQVGQKVFARWDNGEGYFPGIVSAVNGNQLDISFLDGDKGTVPIADVLELHKAFTTLKLHGNWQNGGEWYSGRITKTEPLTMQYDDGDVEEIKLEQLRGVF
ncbi:MAG: hypothetical protein FWD96_01990 [Defluviitaleaceae bacterium]|nr:hypothetical protein [Defluviitaleaceae bacterium]